MISKEPEFLINLLLSMSSCFLGLLAIQTGNGKIHIKGVKASVPLCVFVSIYICRNTIEQPIELEENMS